MTAAEESMRRNNKMEDRRVVFDVMVATASIGEGRAGPGAAVMGWEVSRETNGDAQRRAAMRRR